MKIWLISLITVISMTVIGLLLRVIAEKSINGLHNSWTKSGKENLKIVWKENWVLGFLLSLEGIFSNIGLIGLIIGIPLCLIFGI